MDVAFLDACFYDAQELSQDLVGPGRQQRDMSQVPHPLITDTLQRLQGLLAVDDAADYNGASGEDRSSSSTRNSNSKKKPQIVLIHMNHTNPVWRGRDSAAYQACVAAGVRIGQQGQVYEL